MIRIDVISAVPDLLHSPMEHSMVQKARDGGFLEVVVHDLRNYTLDKHNKIDDYPYGGASGMVLTAQPIFSCIRQLQAERTYDEVIFMAPDGVRFNQKMANTLSLKGNLILLCGHYKGVDQRVRDALITLEISLGDFVLSGGEIPALAVIDSIARLIPGVLGDAESALEDSFQEELLGPPVYTRPPDFEGMTVPEVLKSGNHARIKQWEYDQSVERTKERRPDLYKKFLNEH
ncbi:MAG: tRNA (guanine37-N1)-methyltransferase TrmD [Bacteroidetes bacterium HLUCCA01]|nr:MAG: tRNA (guanine37-N1)-methyltransferase TrmD [Bacteroidetes bacterium HLUCCA01]